MQNDAKKRAACWPGLGLLAVLSVWVISPHSVVTLAASLVLVSAAAVAVLGQAELPNCLKAYVVYVLAAVVLYVVQVTALPEYYGFSGGLGIGADDSYYFSLASPDLPADFPTRQGYFLRVDPYGSLLRVFGNVIYASFDAVHPLDLLILNVSVLSLLPSLVAGIAARLEPGEAVARLGWWMTLTCPFIAANSAILVRDGLITTAFAGAVLAVLQRRVLLLLIWVGLAGYLRLQHGLMLLGVAWMVWTAGIVTANDTRHRTSIGALRILTICVVPPLLAAAAGVTLLGERAVTLIASNPLVRQEFFQTFILEGVARDSGTSTFYQLSQLPWPLRLPLAFGFYFLSPLADLGRLAESHIFVIRDYLLTLFGVLVIAYSAFFFRAGGQAAGEKRWTLIAIIVALCFCLLLVSQASMQLRHKLPLMALFYPVVAIGAASTPTRAVRLFGLLVAITVGCVQILFNEYKLL